MRGRSRDERTMQSAAAATRAAPYIAAVARAVARDEIRRAVSADPPKPIPAWLMPQRAALGPDDLCVVLSVDELHAFVRALDVELGDRGPTHLRFVHRDGSPWIECDAAVSGLGAVARTLDSVEALAPRIVRLALWRYTCAVYRVGDDGAVEDDPFYRPEQEPR